MATDATTLIHLWGSAVHYFLEYEEPEDANIALIRRDAVADILRSETVPPDLLEELDRIDREFIRIRPILAKRFPTEFNPTAWHASEDEWWWWPDRLPSTGRVRRAS